MKNLLYSPSHADKFSVFISYADKEKEMAEGFSDSLKYFFPWSKIFLAHRDLASGENYEDNLKDAIRKSGIFVPLISKKFLDSSYANQEVGFAVSLDKKIFPIKIDTSDPPGFIHLLQAHPMPTSIRKDGLMERLVISLIEHMKVATSDIVLQSLYVRSFYHTDILAKILQKRDDFSEEDVRILEIAYDSNSQINGCESGQILNEIIEKYQ